MKILLSGAFGYLGRHLQDEFRIPKYEIITLGRNPDADIVEDIAKSFRINEDFDIVVHAAGKAHSVPKTQKEENDFYTVNTIGTHNLLNALQNNIPRYFIFISTVAVYGIEKGFLHTTGKILF